MAGPHAGEPDKGPKGQGWFGEPHGFAYQASCAHAESLQEFAGPGYEGNLRGAIEIKRQAVKIQRQLTTRRSAANNDRSKRAALTRQLETGSPEHVTAADFDTALTRIEPSVTQAQLAQYAQWSGTATPQ